MQITIRRQIPLQQDLQIKELTDQNKNLNVTLYKQSKETRILNERIRKLEAAEKKALDGIRAFHTQAQETLVTFQTTIQELIEATVSKAEKSLDAFDSRIQNAFDVINAKPNNNLAAAINRNREYLRIIADLRDKLERSYSICETRNMLEMENELIAVKNELDKATKTNASLPGNTTAIANEIQELRTFFIKEIESLQKENTVLKTQCANGNATICDLNVELLQTKHKVRELNDSIFEFRISNRRFSDQVREHEKTIARLRAHVAEHSARGCWPFSRRARVNPI